MWGAVIFAVFGGRPAVATHLYQLFITLMIANPEPQKPISPSQRQRPIAQRNSCRPHFQPARFSNSLEL